MREFQEKQNIRKKLYSKPVIILLALISVVMVKGVIGILIKEKESRMEVERLEKIKMDLEARLQNVSQNTAALKTDEGVESEIRNRYDVVKEGEEVIVLVDKELPPPPEEKKSFLQKFWDSVTGVFRDESEGGSDKKDINKNEKSDDQKSDESTSSRPISPPTI